MRYWYALQAALAIPDLRGSPLIAKVEDVRLLLERNEFLLNTANPSNDDFNAIRNLIVSCKSRPKECIETIQQLHGFYNELS